MRYIDISGNNGISGKKALMRNSSGIAYIRDSTCAMHSEDSLDSLVFTNHGQPAQILTLAESVQISGTLIMVAGFYDTGKNFVLAYVEFNTSTDSWQNATNIYTLDAGAINLSSTSYQLDLCVDSNGDVHIFFIDVVANMGTEYGTLYYTNNIGGSFKTPVEIYGRSQSDNVTAYGALTCDISSTNIPEALIITTTGAVNARAVRGNATNATSFTVSEIATADTHTPNATYRYYCDVNGNSHVLASYANNWCRIHRLDSGAAFNTTNWESEILTLGTGTGCPTLIGAVLFGSLMIAVENKYVAPDRFLVLHYIDTSGGTNTNNGSTKLYYENGSNISLKASQNFNYNRAGTDVGYNAGVAGTNYIDLVGDEIALSNYLYKNEIALPTTTTLNTTDLTDFGTDDTPTLEFTGDSIVGDDITYEVNIDRTDLFWGTRNQIAGNDISKTADGTFAMYANNIERVAVKFTPTENVYKGRFAVKMRKIGSPTGNIRGYIYTDSGSNTPSAFLYTVFAKDISTYDFAGSVNGDTEWAVEEVNSGNILIAGTTYWFLILFSDGDASNYLEVSYTSDGVSNDNVTFNGSTYTNTVNTLLGGIWQEKVLQFYNDSASPTYTDMYANTLERVGVRFTGDGNVITKLRLPLIRSGTSSSPVRISIVTDNGGNPAIGYTSQVVHKIVLLSDLPTTYGLTSQFEVEIDQPFRTEKGTIYWVMVTFQEGSLGTFYIRWAKDASWGGSIVNKTYNGSTWSTSTDGHRHAIIIDNDSQILNISVEDAGFANTVSGGDTNPFNDNEKVSFTVQAGNELDNGDWYWRVRSGSKFVRWATEDYSSTRMFEINASSSTVLAPSETTHAHTTENVALTQKNTLAVQETAHAHIVDNVALIQHYTLVVQDAVHGHTADSPTPVISYTIAVNETAHDQTADSVNLLQAHVLALNDTAHGHIADGDLALTQKFNLVVQDALHSHIADNVTLNISVTLVVQEAFHSHVADNTALTQKNTLTTSEAFHGQTADNVDLTQGYQLVTQEANHGHVADNVDLTQKNTLVVSEAFHGLTSDTPTLSLSVTLVVQGADHSHIADNVVLTQKSTLVVSETSHIHTSDNVSLTQKSTLVVSETAHVHTADSVVLSVSANLVVQEASHSHVADNVDLVQSNVLVVSEATHGQTADNVGLIQKNTLVVSETNHTQVADNVDLSTAGNLSVAETLHNHIADNVDLVQKSTLVVSETNHSLSTQSVELVQKSTLVVSEATHNHIADNVTLSTAGVLGVQETTHSHIADNVDLTQKNTLAVQEATHNQTADNVDLVVAGHWDLVVQEATHGQVAESVVITQKSTLVVSETAHNQIAETPTLIQGNVLFVDSSAHNHIADVVILEQKSILAVSEAFHVLTSDNVRLIGDVTIKAWNNTLVSKIKTKNNTPINKISSWNNT